MFSFAVPISSEISFEIQELRTKYNNKHTFIAKTHSLAHTFLRSLYWTRSVRKQTYLLGSFFHIFYISIPTWSTITSSPGRIVCVCFQSIVNVCQKTEFALLQGNHMIWLIDRERKTNHIAFLCSSWLQCDLKNYFTQRQRDQLQWSLKICCNYFTVPVSLVLVEKTRRENVIFAFFPFYIAVDLIF